MVTMVRRHHHGLRPGPPEKVRSEAIVDQPQHREAPAFTTATAWSRADTRRGRHRGIRQPSVEGEHRRLHAEAEERPHEGRLQRKLIPAREGGVQEAAVGEVQVPHAVVEQNTIPMKANAAREMEYTRYFRPA